MDVFNQALKNPLPPVRRDNSNTSPSESPNSRNDDPHRPLSANSVRHDETENETANEQSSGPPSAPNGYADSTGSKETSNNVTSDDDNDQYRKRKSSRRKHRNSHLGCGTCKKRRIKCDENLPQCFNCVKGKLHCAYLNLDAPARNALRMAQYNQNLRQDGSKDKKDDKKEVIIPGALPAQLHQAPLPPQLNPAGQAAVVPPNGQYPAFVPYHIVPHPASMGQEPLAMGASPQIITQQANGIPQASYAQLVSFQPVGTVGGAVAYSPMPVQVVPSQVPMVYHSIQEDHGMKIPPLAVPQYPQVQQVQQVQQAQPPQQAQQVQPIQQVPQVAQVPQVQPAVSSTNSPLVKNQSYTELMVAMGHYPPPGTAMATSAPQMADSSLMVGPPPPSVPISDPARFSSALATPSTSAPKIENEPVKLPIIQTNDNSNAQSATHSNSGSGAPSYAHSKAASASSSSATSPVIQQGDKIPAISKLLS